MTAVKFCGMTRPDDVRLAADLGARYVGFILAPSPRRLTMERAAELSMLVAGEKLRLRRVGVFGEAGVAGIVSAADRIGLDVLQLHGSRNPSEFDALRSRFPGEIWAVVRVRDDGISTEELALFDVADGVVLDTWSSRALGGTGAAFDWSRSAREVALARRGVRLIVAGGLRAENVRAAIEALDPDVVDVSSGVESAPGMKDAELMREFMKQARGEASDASPTGFESPASGV